VESFVVVDWSAIGGNIARKRVGERQMCFILRPLFEFYNSCIAQAR